MKRLPAAILTTAVALTGVVLTASPARAIDTMTTISRVTATWTSGAVRVHLDYDSWAYGRVEVRLSDAPAVVRVLPPWDIGSKTITVPRSIAAGPAEVDVRIVSCDSDALEDPNTVCTTRTAFSAVVLPVTKVGAGRASAVALLNGLRVANEQHASSYRSSRFGGWLDANRDGERTRTEVLKAESTKRAAVARGAIRTGRWLSKYDGRTLTSASSVVVDHLVPLKEAWMSGAATWSAKKRAAFTNDLGYGASLIAVSASAQQSKGSKDPASWLPSLRPYRCAYIKNYVAVKSRWRLSVDPAEKAAITGVLASCSNYAVVKPAAPALAKLLPAAPKRPSTGSSSSAGTSSSPTHGVDPQYRTCTELLKHPNHAPYHRGVDPEYSWYQDRDGDGWVCE